MTFWKKALLGALLFLTPLGANLTDPNVQAATEGDPANTLCDCVSLLTGDFVAFAEDHVIEGAQPLPLRRYYVSGDGEGEYGGWEFFPHIRMTLIPKKTEETRKKTVGKDFRRIEVREPNGTMLHFKRDGKHDVRQNWVPYKIDFEKRGKGVTNLSRGEVSGQHNLRNTILYQETKNKFVIHCADGTLRTYLRGKVRYVYPRFFLTREELPNGNFIKYKYNDDDQLTEVYATNPTGKKIYASCKISYHKNKFSKHGRNFQIETSDGQIIKYLFDRVGDWDPCRRYDPYYTLKRVERPCLPTESEIYTSINPIASIVNKRTLPEGREVKADYYSEGSNTLPPGKNIHIASPAHSSLNRVKALYQSVGEEGKSIPTHQFIYEVERKKIDDDFVYSPKGVTHVFDCHQNKTTIYYNDKILTSAVQYHEKDTLHHLFKMEWEEFGQLKKKRLLDAEEIPKLEREFVYDDWGNPTQEHLRGNICKKDSLDTWTKQHKYDDRNRLIETRSPSGLITQYAYLGRTNLLTKKIITDDDEIHIRELYEYNNDNILISKTIDDGADDFSHRTIERITPKKEAPAQNLPEIIEELALNPETGEEILLSKVKLSYNKLAKVIAKEVYDSSNTLRYTLHYEYDDKGRLIQENDARGNITAYSYDALGNLTEQVDPSGKVTQRVYDCGNRLIEEIQILPSGEERKTHYKYDPKNQKIASTDPFGSTTTYEYDPFGHQTQVIHPDGAVESSTYDILGHLTSQTNPLGHTTFQTHNILGKPLEIVHTDGSIDNFTYSVEGVLTSRTDGEGNTTLFTHDALGRQTQIKYQDSTGKTVAAEHSEYSSLHLLSHTDKDGVKTRFTYDFAGRKVCEEKEHMRTEYEYDSMSRPLLERHITPTGNLIHRYERDLLGRITKEAYENEDGDILQTTSYTFDTESNPIEVIRPDGIETYCHDAFNRLVEKTNGEGHTTTITYDETYQNSNGQTVLRTITTDPLGYQCIEIFDVMLRPSRKEVRSQDGTLLFAEDYIHDLAGNQILHQSHVYQEESYIHTLEITKTFDEMGRVSTITEGDKESSFTYDLNNRIHCYTKPDGTALVYSYDIFGNQTELISSDEMINISYQYTPNGHLLSATDHINETTTERTLDRLGNLLKEELANGLIIEATYDSLNRRTQLTLPSNATVDYIYNPLYLSSISALGHTFSYRYNHSGQLTSKNKSSYIYNRAGKKIKTSHCDYKEEITYNPRGHIDEIQANNIEYTFNYDGLGQLTQEKGHNYSYDSLYNRLEKDGVPHESDATHALIQAGETTFTHDPNGNPITKTTPTLITHYKYDALDRLIEVITDGTRLTFTYDPLHRRMTKTLYQLQNSDWVEAKHLRFLYDGENEIGAFDKADTLIELRILGGYPASEQDTLLLLIEPTLYEPIQDIFGNTLFISSFDRQKLYSYQYNAFGEEVPSLGPNPWRYRSKRYDEESGLIYFGRRYYDPEHGRFLTPDPTPLTDSVNLYAYTYNNPLSFEDLYGRFSTDSSDQPVVMKEFDPEAFARWHYQQAFRSNDYLPCEIPPITFEQPRIYNLGRTELNDKMILFVNGIKNDSSNHWGSLEYLSDLGGGVNVTGVHLPTYGLVFDVIHANKYRSNHITPGVREIHKALDNFFDNSSPTSTVLAIGHSMGNAAIRNALMIYDPERRKRIFVVSIAGAMQVIPETCGGLRSYVSKGDRIHQFDETGLQRYGKHIQWLTPHPKAPWFDHTFQSPTYRDVLKDNVSEYIKKGTINIK